MAAYIIVYGKVSNPEQYKQYQALSPGAVKAAGGEFIVRGGRSETLEGTLHPDRVVLLRFESYEAGKAFYDSELYLAARQQRAGATEYFNAVLVEGV